MASSGIAEHNEARRREVGYLKKAHELLNKEKYRALKVSQNEYELYRGGHSQGSTYDAQLQRMQNLGVAGNSYDAASVDRQRRLAHYNAQKQVYSAKLPNRYSSTDYISQW